MICDFRVITIIIIIILIIGIATLVVSKKNNETFSTPEQDAIINQNNATINTLAASLNTNLSSALTSGPSREDVDQYFIQKVNEVSQSINDVVDSSKTATDADIINITNQIVDLENSIDNILHRKQNESQYSTIKSLNNGLELKISPSKFYNDTRTGSNVAVNMVNVNCGCLSVGSNGYEVVECNPNDPKQYFKLNNVLNENDYENNIDMSIAYDNVNKSKIQYPFSMVKSLNNNNCLTNNHGSLTVQPCYSYAAQRWIPM